MTEAAAAKPFIPSSATLLSMIASAEAKCDGDREQVLLRTEAHAIAREVRAATNVAKARAYRRIQHGLTA